MKSLFSKTWCVFTCERYTELASRALDQDLSFSERLGFYLHHVICTFCRRSRRQLALIEHACQKLEQEENLTGAGESGLSDQAKEKIAKVLDNSFKQ